MVVLETERSGGEVNIECRLRIFMHIAGGQCACVNLPRFQDSSVHHDSIFSLEGGLTWFGSVMLPRSRVDRGFSS